MDFELIYQRYFKDVFLYLRSLSANEDVAEELAQETFAKALKAINSYDGQKDIRAWLFTIAKNTYYTICKRQQLYPVDELSESLAAPQPEVIERILDEEDAFRIHAFLHSMSEPYKEVFTLRVFGELSFEKIAELFGKSSSWARVVFYRAKVQIRQYIEEVDRE